MKISTKVLDAAAKAVTGVSGDTELSIVCDKDFSIFSAKEGKYAKAVLDGKAKGKWKTRLLCSVLLEVIKGSAEVDLEMKNESTLLVKVKGTEAEIKTMPFEPAPVIDRKIESQGISEKNQIEILHALAQVSITDIHEAENSKYVYLKIGKREMVVTRFDGYHMAFFETKEVKNKREIEIVASSESFDTISRLAGKHGYDFSMTDSIRAWNDWFEVQLPLIQAENQQSLSDVTALIKSLKDSKGEQTVSKDELFAAVEKCAAVYETESSVEVESSSKGLKLGIKTSYGQVKTLVPGKGKGSVKCNIDPHLLMDTLRPIGAKELTLKFNDRLAFVRVKEETRNSVYAFVLVQSKKKKG